MGSDQNINLESLLTDKSEIKSHFRKRNNAFEFKSIHPADTLKFLEKGWQVQREGIRSTRIKRPKSHDRLLEDKIWCFLYRMGYSHLNGDRYVIHYERDDGTQAKKQIDAIGFDGETAIVIECKSKEDRGRRSLKKDIAETIYLQERIRKSIYALSDSKQHPKIIWIYATHNIIWSEPDVADASAGKIQIVTENESQYFEAFLKHMGPAGRYQILGEFLAGEKIPTLSDVKLPAVKGKIGGETYYSFVTTPRNLLKIAFVNHQALNHPDGRPAYQRMVRSSRIKEIGKFIEEGGYFPTNILVNFTEPVGWEFMSNKENSDPNIKFGWIHLPNKYRSAWIIDGQHRLFGFSHLEGNLLDQSLFVLAFEKMDTRKEADLFITINHKQKSVPKSLLVSLLSEIRMGDHDPKVALQALASAIVKSINADPTSPFFRRFTIPDVPPEENQNLTISEVVNGLTRSGLLGKIVNKQPVPGILHAGTDEKTILRTKKVLNGYFNKLMEAHPKRWATGKQAYVSVNPGIRAHLMLIAEVAKYVELRRSIDLAQVSDDDLIGHITELTAPIAEYIRQSSDDEIKEKFSRKFGEGGVKEYLYNLCEIINAESDDFGSDEFRKFIKEKTDDRIESADQFVINLTKEITDYIFDALKAIHGTHKMPSGASAYWAIGVESKNAKKKALDKQLYDEPNKQMPIEAYLDILDLRDIVKQKNNWPHFQHVFNLPMAGEKKGKIYYLAWMERFNELRRIPAHKSSFRTYSEEDYEFLEWLRSEFHQRLMTAMGKASH